MSLPASSAPVVGVSTVDTTSFSVSLVSEDPTTITENPAPATNDGPEATTAPPVVQTPSVVVITSESIRIETADGATSNAPETVLITSTESAQRFPTPTTTSRPTTSASSASTSSAGAVATAGANSGDSDGLSNPAKIAVAVVVPVVSVALIVLAALIFWRKRKQRKEARDLRRKEVEDYGFNPNNDPTLPVVGGASSNGDEGEMTQTDGAGYRGWGTTSTARKASTTLSSGNGPIGVARSTSGSDNGRYPNGSPTGGTNKSSDVHSNDPLVGSPPNGRPLTGDSETIGALGAVPSNDNRQQNIHRGPSNASSAYSGAHRSDTSGEGIIPGGAPGQQFYNDGLYYDEGMPQHGPYGDGSYGGAQPVIRDVPARRNTRIENPSVIPAQGSAGISQNF